MEKKERNYEIGKKYRMRNGEAAEYDSTGAVVSGRRQFDVSKLPTRIHHASIYDEGKFDGEYFLKEKVLEAWNAGTIEELLEGWTK